MSFAFRDQKKGQSQKPMHTQAGGKRALAFDPPCTQGAVIQTVN